MALLSQVPVSATQKQACTVLDALIEILGATMKEYFDMLMQALPGRQIGVQNISNLNMSAPPLYISPLYKIFHE